MSEEMVEETYKANLERIFLAINKLNSYCINIEKSTKKTIENFDFEDIFEQVLCFLDEQGNEIETLGAALIQMETSNINVSQRLKSEQSLRNKWVKNLGKKKQLREVINDIIGIRMITDQPYEELIKIIKQINEEKEYNISIIDFHQTPKAVDDGYRGIHIYFKKNPKGFPIEVQIWNQEDALLNFYTHDIIYKANKDGLCNEYGSELRKWLDAIPSKPDGIEIGYIKYLYEIVYASQGGE